MTMPPGLHGKAGDRYPFTFESDVMPAGFRGRRCRKIQTKPRDAAQGLVMVKFQNASTPYLVLASKLRRVGG